MTRVTKLLSKEPAEGTAFVAKPLMLKKSEIEQKRRRGGSEVTLEKRTRRDTTSDNAGGSRFKKHRPEGGRDRGRGRGQGRGRGRGQGRRGGQQRQSERQTNRPKEEESNMDPDSGRYGNQGTTQHPPEDRSKDEIILSETTVGTIEPSLQGGDDDDFFAALHQKQDGKSTLAPTKVKSRKSVVLF